MSKLLPKNILVKLAEALFSSGFEIETIKVVHEYGYGYGLNPFYVYEHKEFLKMVRDFGHSFNGVELKIAQSTDKNRLIPKRLPKDSLTKIAEALFSNGYEIEALKTSYSRWLKRFKGIELRISRIEIF